MPSRPRARRANTSSHPFEDSLASVMLAAALEASDRSMAELGREAGYTGRCSLSQMATGLAPIPVAGAERIARVTGLDEGVFTMAVLHQRHPEAAETLLASSPQGTDMLVDASILSRLRARLRDKEEGLARMLAAQLSRPFPWHGMAKTLTTL